MTAPNRDFLIGQLETKITHLENDLLAAQSRMNARMDGIASTVEQIEQDRAMIKTGARTVFVIGGMLGALWALLIQVWPVFINIVRGDQ